jgi:HEAT repeat protein
LGVWNRSPDWLVSSFDRLTDKSLAKEELHSDRTLRTLAGDLVDVLVPYEEPSSKSLIERVAHCSGKTDWGILFVIDLLGKRRVRSAIPAIIDCFGIDSEHFAHHAAEALIRIGNEEAVQHLRERMPYEDEGFRARATWTLAGFKHIESEWLLLDLLEGERDLTLKALYGHGLCCHYSIRGERQIRRLIVAAAPEDARRLKIGLLVTSIIQGRDLPEASEWREEILDYHQGSEEMEPALATSKQ